MCNIRCIDGIDLISDNNAELAESTDRLVKATTSVVMEITTEKWRADGNQHIDRNYRKCTKVEMSST